MFARTIRTFVAMAISAAAASPALAQHWNASDDWSQTNNPNSVWTYGASSALGSIAPATAHGYGCGGNAATVDCWALPSGAQSNAAVIYHNLTNTTQSFPGVSIAPGVLLEDAQTSEYAVVRWTAPSAGIYNVFGMFQGDGRGASFYASTGQYVLVNGVSMYSFDAQTTAANGNFNFFTTALSAGSTIDFVSENLGYGPGSNSYGYFSANIDAQPVANTTPEPASFALLGTGLVGLVPALRRRKR